MSKELETLGKIHNNWNCMNPNSNDCDNNDFKLIETALKDYERLKRENFELMERVGFNATYKDEIDINEVDFKNTVALYEYFKFNKVSISQLEDMIKKLKALEIIKETPEFAWYVKIYENVYEMITDVKGFRTNESAEELQEKFDLLKEVLL